MADMTTVAEVMMPKPASQLGEYGLKSLVQMGPRKLDLSDR